MRGKNNDVILNRLERIAHKVYRDHENSIYMLINDLEDFFEVNMDINDASKMTSEEFDNYIKKILNN